MSAKIYARQLELHPNHNKEQYARKLARDPDHVDKRKAKYAKATPAEIEARKVRARLQYERNREEYIQRAAEWAAKNRDATRAAKRKWSQDNRDKVQAATALRRARLASRPGSFTAAEFRTLIDACDGRCQKCMKSETELGETLTPDHIIPIAYDGSTNWITNIAPLCGACNSSKNCKIEWWVRGEIMYEDWVSDDAKKPLGRKAQRRG